MVDDHERIWLQHPSDMDPEYGRLWCQDKTWPNGPDESEPTEYVRADLFDALTEERDRLKQWQADQVEVNEEAKALITELNADKKALEAERDRLERDRDFWKEQFQVETRYRIELADKGTLQALTDANSRMEKAEAERDQLAKQVDELQELFRIDGEDHASVVRYITNRHETRIAKYAERIKELRDANAELLAGLEQLKDRKPFFHYVLGPDLSQPGSPFDRGKQEAYREIKTFIDALLDKHKATSTEREGK